MTEDEISYIVRGVIFEVYNILGPGLYESVYETVIAKKLSDAGLQVSTQVALPLIIDGIHFDSGFRVDMIVEGKVIVEIKSVETLHEVHHKQLITYLKLSKLKLGLLVNFNTDVISKSIFRKVNNLNNTSA